MWLLNKSNQKMSSRRQINIKEVKDGVLVLPNNQYRVAIETSSINFELKSELEQDVLIDSFQNFLNSLPCQLQILIRVREIDIDNYLEEISKGKQLQEEINNYCDFIKTVVSGNKILSRRFYVVVPYHSINGSKDFEFIKEQIRLNCDLVTKSLEKLGMKAKQLDGLEILDLFYSFYNPGQTKTQELRGQTIQTLLQNNYV